ncbi:UDP-N-acetylmuramate--L-alanine ligase [Sulfobacillus sp. hq2]|uniref:UDP-N-acetylmuramate--L-alanine ligase n=1 Tax=Sulfobacillus TaxID=28033 RepID=UPI000CD194B5|nr:UDP-N-acetylmuramate--L-alanine ligase [Sulfobacillus sp. hq2]POB11900.1 UDP-N-acetylmuramate--L-alanine ligase [Sulfobacillus sp. hq2]
MTHVHFIGIGGYSMSGLALLLKHQGYEVTGSDVNPSSRTERVERQGITVQYVHRPENVAGADWVVYNTDVAEDNPERAEAVRLGIPLYHRSEILARVLEGFEAITVSGTHGKTTTTTMIGTILQDAGADPAVLVGGEVAQFEGNVRVGHGRYAVAEADESDGTFLRYHPWVAVATNVEPEHLDHYEGSFDALQQAFAVYLNKVPDTGLAVIGVDNPVLRTISQTLAVPFVTYGLTEEAMLRATNIQLTPALTRYTVMWQNQPVGTATLAVPGVHNVVNSLAALAVAHHTGIAWDDALQSLATFSNAQRRFQVIVDTPVMIVDDYAHHPTEIRSTLQACRQRTPGRIFALFQPQRYIRTKNLWTEFTHAFDDADELYLTEIYAPPGEAPIAGVSGERLAQAIADQGKTVHFRPDMFSVVEDVLGRMVPGDTFITMGAGNVYMVGRELAKKLEASDVAGSGL